MERDWEFEKWLSRILSIFLIKYFLHFPRYLREFTYGKVSQTGRDYFNVKITSIVKSLILQLLGTFTEFFPDFMSDKSKQLLAVSELITLC